jgi:uncharacterized protein (TIGR02145 family)
LFIERLPGFSSSILISSVASRRPFFYNYELEITNEKNKLLTKKEINMKKNLLLMMMCCPVILAAQNGVTVSNLAVAAGTVTFNVNWKNTSMPTLWSDTVWVFVDYNNKGVMERLPLSPGATLTATSPGGKVIEETGNNKGVWVVGNARSTGSFSATVKLLTAVMDVGGACVYGSNYPPVGKYISTSEISFIGTPEYKVVLERGDKSTYTATVDKNEPLPIPNGEVALSFTDKTGAPGTFTCIPSTIYDLEVSASSFCEGGIGVTFALSGTDDGQIYELYRDGTLVVATLDGDGSAATFSDAMNVVGTYTARTIPGGVFCPAEMNGNLPVAIITDPTSPGAMVDFTAFNPCTDAAVGTVWYLTDTREASYNNTRMYKVKKMQDGRIWMVQDMKFGNLCGITFSGSNGSDQTGKVSNIGTYYGDCTTLTNGGTPPARGYLYDWAAAINKAEAYYGTTTNPGCSGTGSSANACQGICPAGWHIPTGYNDGEFYDLHYNYGRNCATNNDDCWDASSTWEGVLGGYCTNSGSLGGQGGSAYYWSSTYFDSDNAYRLTFNSNNVRPGINAANNYAGFTVRCVRNY